MKRRKVEAWAVVSHDGDFKGFNIVRSGVENDCFYPEGERVIRLVEHDPAADAVVREARRLIDRLSPGAYPSLGAAVRRLEKQRKR